MEVPRTSFRFDGTKQIGSELTREITGLNLGCAKIFTRFPQLFQANSELVNFRLTVNNTLVITFNIEHL
jgi:hypothetical protein